MKLEIIKVKCDEFIECYRKQSMHACCEKILNVPGVDFFHDVIDSNTNEEIDMGVCFFSREEVAAFGHDYTESNYLKFDYCPFCGKKIDISIVKEEDITREYGAAEAAMQAIGEKIRKCDSMKKTRELKNEFNAKCKELQKLSKTFSISD